MKDLSGFGEKHKPRSGQPQIIYGERLRGLESEIRDVIAHRAYEFFEARGYKHGNDLEDWFRAESELLQPLKIDTWKAEQELLITAEIPGFRPEEIKIGIEPRRVIIWGKLDPKPGWPDAYPKRGSVSLFQAVELPAKVDTSKASASFADGLLKLDLPF